MKHTPGPWTSQSATVNASDGWIGSAFISKSNNDSDGTRTHEESKANAMLMAAAPELLQLLEEAVLLVRDRGIAEDPVNARFDARFLEQAALVMAKAGGELK